MYILTILFSISLTYHVCCYLVPRFVGEIPHYASGNFLPCDNFRSEVDSPWRIWSSWRWRGCETHHLDPDPSMFTSWKVHMFEERCLARTNLNMFWLVVWNIFIFPYIGNNHPNWLIFFRGVQTTNQCFNIRLLSNPGVEVVDESSLKRAADRAVVSRLTGMSTSEKVISSGWSPCPVFCLHAIGQNERTDLFFSCSVPWTDHSYSKSHPKRTLGDLPTDHWGAPFGRCWCAPLCSLFLAPAKPTSAWCRWHRDFSCPWSEARPALNFDVASY